jgi:biotin carboxylase
MIILQNVATFRIHWSCLYNPEAYRLILITSSANYERLLASEQEQFFDKVIRTDDFSLDNLVTISQQVLRAFDITDLGDVRIVTHDEYSLGVAAQLRAALGVEGAHPEDLRPFVDKLEMKRALEGKGIRMPRHLPWNPQLYRRDPEAYLRHVEHTLSLPIFVKPLNESGSVGTAKLNTREQLAAWCEAHLDQSGYEMDEWITGTLYHCDSIIRDGRVLYTHVSEYAHPCYDYLSGKICATITLPKDSQDFARLSAFTERVLDAIEQKPRDTVTHLEVFRKPDDELVFLEIAARAPAGMVPYTYAKHLGLNIEEAHFRLHMGILDDLKIEYGPYAAFVYFPHRAGVVTALHQPVLRSNAEISWKINVGDRLVNPENIRDTACTVLLWNDDYDELRRDFAYLDQFEAFSVTQEDDQALQVGESLEEMYAS